MLLVRLVVLVAVTASALGSCTQWESVEIPKPSPETLKVQLANLAGIHVLLTGGWISIVGVTVRVRGK